MNPRKIKDHLCFLKTRVILILNFTRPHAITYTNHKGTFGYQEGMVTWSRLV